MIRFMRTQKVWRGFILLWLTSYVMAVIAWWGMMPQALPIPVNLVMMAINVLVIGGLPYLADRLLVPRLKGFAATLVFPLALTAMDFVSMTTNPVGSCGAQAYNQSMPASSCWCWSMAVRAWFSLRRRPVRSGWPA